MTNRTAIRGCLAAMRGMGAVAAVVVSATFGATPGFAQSAGQEGAAAQPVQQDVQQEVRKSDVGPSALAWLDLQRSNAQAAPAQPMLGAEAGLAYKRYMESFKNRIPEHYGSTFGSGGNGGSGSGSSGGGASGSGGLN
ncbi:DUF3613 domain-containing protein [Paraburkholderia sp. MMS20-SJTR3]|uniref:DUF3613 domain-containing protein n=1 Tax=Paraburkholderia sejongensis TaxID=2886946 RepID=A0ABS8JMP0_9BURK|nr:DUF3613 domain-containing protein [Paraburkholderia sp. MMS20-SJTR3]MCC8391175.1 DUF3613 domain-containing protein [Paraburkholderia sp. MMS20-SJTR3]